MDQPENSSENLPLPEPRIIPRSQHSISRSNIDPDALKVLYRLHRYGYKAYLVGGSVRDLLLGKQPKDFDVGTDAHPNEVYKLFRNSRIIGRRFRLVQVIFRGGKVIEVSTFRRPAEEDSDEVLGANNTFGTPVEDALRRDLTINALFYNIADFTVVDFVDGLADLQDGLIRGVGDPMIRFHRDPVRILRALRHAARADFKLTPETVEAIDELKDEIMVCPSSRIRDELMRDMKGGASSAWLELAHSTGVLYTLLPELAGHYADPASPARARARGHLAKVDQLIAQGTPPEDAVILTLMLWPALEQRAAKQDFPEGRAGRIQWSNFVRDELPVLARPVAFAKRVMERACQMGGVMGFVVLPSPGQRLPKKVTQKGYFHDAVQLAELLGYDLKALAPSTQKKNPSSRRRRRRRRRKPGGGGQPAGGATG